MSIQASGPTAIYVRISDDPELTRLGVQRQEADCKKLAKDLGWPVAGVYEDNDVSAMSLKKPRPEFERLMADVQAGRIHRLIVWKADRLYRRVAELERIITTFGEKSGVEIRTVKSGNIDLTTANGRMIARILGATAQGEVEQQRERISRKAQELRDAGKFTGGPRPFGWKVVDSKFVEVPQEIAALEEAKKRVLRGDSLHSIVMDFKARGLTGTRFMKVKGTDRKARAPITDTALGTMLQSHRMIGVTAAGVKAPWRALATPKELEQLRLLLSAKRSSKRREGGSWVVTGAILKCGICGKGMYGAPSFAGKPIPHYSCKVSVVGGCGRIAIKAETLETRLMEEIAEYLTGYLYPPKVHGVRPHRARPVNAHEVSLAEATAELGRVQKEIDALMDAVGRGDLTVAESLVAKKALLPRLSQAQKAVEMATAHAVGLVQLASQDSFAFVKNWRTMPLEARKRVVYAVVKEIRVKPHNGALHVPDPDRVVVEFKPEA